MSQLRLPLRRLEPVRRTVDLDAGPLQLWIEAVRASSSDACLVLDADGRLVAISSAAVVALDLSEDCLGAALSDLVRAIDFSAGALPAVDQQRSLPPLQALHSGTTARALLRIRHRDSALVTLDVVSVALARQAGSLSFLQPV